ncbi:response regulator transcription factor [Streptomyces mirabilis]|uniref:response regulator transcription factor n=1 Tax=Streptomyces mirabilis TaxID=68239 RepID=UPI0033BC11AE
MRRHSEGHVDAQVADPFPGVEDDSAEHAESGDRDEHQGEHRGQGVQHGLEATRRILTGASDPPRVIILTAFDLDDLVYAALSAGASGFLLKDVTPEHLVSAVRLVRSGDALLAPTITRRLVERHARRSPETAVLPRGLAPLTPRELEVLRLLAQGLSNTELAAHLHLAEATVKTHTARILAKLGLRDRVQAVVTAYETGLVTPGTVARSPRVPADNCRSISTVM